MINAFKDNRNFLGCVIAIMLVIYLAGCASHVPAAKAWADQATGGSINLLFEAVQAPRNYVARSGAKIGRYQLENGHFVYTAPVWDDCIVHFEVNADGIIIGNQLHGNHCN